LQSFSIALHTIFLAAVIGSLPAMAADEMRYAWPVIGIKDGDTLTVNLPGLPPTLNPVAVRLRSVDTPESGGRAKCASERKLAEPRISPGRPSQRRAASSSSSRAGINTAAGSTPMCGSTASCCPIS
jgi:endonuclease YncB( thermonuclease family)